MDMSSIFGKEFTVSTWGESHGKAIGAVIDGCPAGVPLCAEDIQKFLIDVGQVKCNGHSTSGSRPSRYFIWRF